MNFFKAKLRFSLDIELSTYQILLDEGRDKMTI